MSNTLKDRCLAFVQEQSAGEWGEKEELEDSIKLYNFVAEEINRQFSDLNKILLENLFGKR